MISNRTKFIIAAGAAFLVYTQYQRAKAVVTTKLNPASDQNLVYQGVNAAGEKLTGQTGFSLGSWLYDVMNPNEAERLGLSEPGDRDSQRQDNRNNESIAE